MQKEDQVKINQFSRLNMRAHEIEQDIKGKKAHFRSEFVDRRRSSLSTTPAT